MSKQEAKQSNHWVVDMLCLTAVKSEWGGLAFSMAIQRKRTTRQNAAWRQTMVGVSIRPPVSLGIVKIDHHDSLL